MPSPFDTRQLDRHQGLQELQQEDHEGSDQIGPGSARLDTLD